MSNIKNGRYRPPPFKKPIEKTAFIKYEYDPVYDMERLTVNGKCVGFGNSYDNHCHDRYEALIESFDVLEIKYIFEKNESWDSNER